MYEDPMEPSQCKRPPVARTSDSVDRVLDRIDESAVDQIGDGPAELLTAPYADFVIP